MHQNKAMATAATAFASNFRGTLDLLTAPEVNGLFPISVHPSFLFPHLNASEAAYGVVELAATDRRDGDIYSSYPLSSD